MFRLLSLQSPEIDDSIWTDIFGPTEITINYSHDECLYTLEAATFDGFIINATTPSSKDWELVHIVRDLDNWPSMPIFFFVEEYDLDEALKALNLDVSCFIPINTESQTMRDSLMVVRDRSKFLS